MTIEPIGDRVFVRRDPTPDEQGGLVIPDLYKSQYHKRTGTVVAVGPGMLRHLPSMGMESVSDRLPMQCKVGDRVVVPHQCELLRLNPADEKDELLVCQECQLIAILRE